MILSRYIIAIWFIFGVPILVNSAELSTPNVRIQVVPDRPDWTYRLGDPARFVISATADGVLLSGVSMQYDLGPDMLPAETHAKETLSGSNGTVYFTMVQPGFTRCVATVEFGGKNYRGVGTAGFSPEKIRPVQVNPDGFDGFWAAQIADLRRIPLDPQISLQPDLCTAEVDVFHVSFKNVATVGSRPTRIYGMLCVPKAVGLFPAILYTPGAGARPYAGARELAREGFITLEIGIHGIPVNLPLDVYEELRYGALGRYNVYDLDNKELYYYRRVYLGCVRANDFLVSHPKYDGRNLAVAGSSQGGQLAIITAALDSRVRTLASSCPAYCDVTGYIHGRAGGWPHMFRPNPDGSTNQNVVPSKIETTAYYDVVNFASRLKVPGYYTWGYNDEISPPTSLYAAYNVIAAPKQLMLIPRLGHGLAAEQKAGMDQWLREQLKLDQRK